MAKGCKDVHIIWDGLHILDIDNFFWFSYLVSHNDLVSHLITSHARLGHIAEDYMTRLARVGLLGSLAKVHLLTYELCLAEKTTRKPFGKLKGLFPSYS